MISKNEKPEEKAVDSWEDLTRYTPMWTLGRDTFECAFQMKPDEEGLWLDAAEVFPYILKLQKEANELRLKIIKLMAEKLGIPVANITNISNDENKQNEGQP